jgi:hypothetical protein
MIESTESKLQSARDAVGAVAFPIRAAFVNVHALREVLADKQNGLISAFGQHPRPDPLHIPNGTSHPYHIASVATEDYMRLKASLALIESTDEWIEADRTLSPLVENVHELERQLAEETTAANRARQDRITAFEAAKAEAIAKVEAKFAQ